MKFLCDAMRYVCYATTNLNEMLNEMVCHVMFMRFKQTPLFTEDFETIWY